jgi:arginase
MAVFHDSCKVVTPGTVVTQGIPFDEYSSFMRGSASAPRHIREALHSDSSNLWSESGIDLAEGHRLMDVGDMALQGDTPVFTTIETGTTHFLERGDHVLSLGGDHSITYPLIRAFSRKYTALNLLQFDAHPDLYDEFEGNRHSHACPFARIMEERLVSRLVQVGVRTANRHQREQAERFGVEMIEMRHFHSGMALKFDGPLYISLDMDVFDPAYAPGVSHHEPGGVSVREIIDMINAIDVPIVGADIVEYNPARDHKGITAMTAAKLLKEIAACMLKPA